MNRFSLGLAALIFAGTGTMHFVTPDAFVQIVPPMLPAKEALVAISGAAELAGAAGLLIPQTRRYAAYGLIALLVAVFPANIYMALDRTRFASLPEWALIARLPLQFLLIAWIWGLRDEGA
jgi:uncharacterized membrane protein